MLCVCQETLARRVRRAQRMLQHERGSQSHSTTILLRINKHNEAESDIVKWRHVITAYLHFYTNAHKLARHDCGWVRHWSEVMGGYRDPPDEQGGNYADWAKILVKLTPASLNISILRIWRAGIMLLTINNLIGRNFPRDTSSLTIEELVDWTWVRGVCTNQQLGRQLNCQDFL